MEENLRLLKPYWRGLPLIIVAMVLAYLAANKYLNYTTPMYESLVKIRLADIDEGVPNSNLFKDLDVFTSSHKITAEIEVMKSHTLIHKVLNQVPFEIEMYRVGNIHKTEIFEDSPFQVKKMSVNSNHLGKSFSVTIKSKNDFIVVSPEGTSYKGHFGDTITFQKTTFVIQLNQDLLDARSNLHLEDTYAFKILDREQLISKIRKNLDISPVDKDVAVVRIIYKSPNPEKSAFLANKLAEVYIQDYIDTKYQAANTTVQFLDSQIVEIAEKLAFTEDTIQDYREQRGITNLRQETETDLRKISQMKIQQSNLRMNLDAIEDLEGYIELGRDNFLELAPNFEAFNDLLSTEIVKNIKKLQADKKDLLLTYTEKADEVKIVDKKIDDLTTYLEESIHNTRKNLETKYIDLGEDIVEAQKVFLPVPEKERIMTILTREFNLFQQSYIFLNEKKIEAEIAQAARVAFHRIITPAQVPVKPVSPNRLIIKVVAMMMAMFGAIAFIFLVHLFKAKVNDKPTIESNSIIPIATTTPRFKNSEAVAAHFQKEAVELELKELVGDGKTICLSAYSDKEGVFFQTHQLAEAFARQGRKVLIIQGDCEKQLLDSKEGLKWMTLNHPTFYRLPPKDLKEKVKSYAANYDITLIQNEAIGTQLSLQTMALADTNLVVVDSRITPAKKIIETDLIKEEYNLPNMHFVLNRFGYNPSIIISSIRFIKKNIKKYKKILFKNGILKVVSS